MDVRRQARLTAGLPSPSCGPLPTLSPLAPVPYIPGFAPIGPVLTHIQQAPYEQQAAYTVAARPQQNSRPQHTPNQRRSQSTTAVTPGVADGPIRKDRRKDRHKRASDGRNPMIRLNPSTADRFFAVQRLLESKRLKKTSGSFVINWLIDVAHASIQAVLEQGVPGADHQRSFQQQQQQQEQQKQGSQRREGGQQGAGIQQLAFELKDQTSDHVNEQHHHSAEGSFQNSHGGRLHHGQPDLGLQLAGMYGSSSNTGDGGDEEEVELLVDDAPHMPLHSQPLHLVATQQSHGFDMNQSGYAHFQPRPQSNFSAADIARSAMAAAEAAEDDEDEEVDVVADDNDSGDGLGTSAGGGSGTGQAQNQGDVLWMRTGRNYLQYQTAVHAGEENDDAEDS